MQCSTARLLLTFARPKASELDAGVVQSLNEHLGECAECGAFARAEHQFERLLGPAMRQVAVPRDLRERLLTRLQAERRSWYKRLPQRHPAIAAAVAAVLLLTVGLVVYAATRPPRPLDLALIAYTWNTRVAVPPQEAQSFFAQEGFKVIVPPEF